MQAIQIVTGLPRIPVLSPTDSDGELVAIDLKSALIPTSMSARDILACMIKPARILIAQEHNSIDVLVEALSGYELIKTTMLSEAERMLVEDGIDLFVIGIHFDDSRAMDLLKFIREDAKHKKTPVVIVRYWPSDYADLLRHTIDVMKTVNAVSAYIEADPGEALPFTERVRQAVEQCLPAKKRAVLIGSQKKTKR